MIKTCISDSLKKIRQKANSRFLRVVAHSQEGGSVFRITPIGKVKSSDKPSEYDNELEWTLQKPKDTDYGSVVLESGKTESGEPFVIDSYDLDSPHAWRRRF